MPLSRSAIYYRNNPAAAKRKQAYDKKLNSRPSQVNKREESNLKRAQAKRRGTNINGKDYDHAVRRFVKSSTNRGRANEGGRKIKFGRRKS
jgi:hypothetical protein